MEDELNLDLSKTYIYEGEEYILTGRSGKKLDTHVNVERPRRSRRRPRKSSSEPDFMVEIKAAPRPSVQGAVVAPNMSKEFQWVKVSELYIVEDKIENDYWEKDDESIDSSN